MNGIKLQNNRNKVWKLKCQINIISKLLRIHNISRPLNKTASIQDHDTDK